MRRILVYGGKGALGSVSVKHFKGKSDWVASIDLFVNEEADANILIKPSDSWADQHRVVCESLEKTLAGEKLDGIFCVAGGWAGGNLASDDIVGSADLMWKQSVWSSLIAANLANKHLKSGGLLQLTGAQPAFSGTPGMIGYGMAKAAVHQLIHSVSSPKSGLPDKALCVGIAPITLDTPGNRKGMPNADFSTWTPLKTVAELFDDWLSGKKQVKSGTIFKLVTTEGKTECIPA